MQSDINGKSGFKMKFYNLFDDEESQEQGIHHLLWIAGYQKK